MRRCRGNAWYLVGGMEDEGRHGSDRAWLLRFSAKKKSVASTAARCKRGDRHRQKARQALALRLRHLCVREPPAFLLQKKNTRQGIIELY
jgi:hypothetical protein